MRRLWFRRVLAVALVSCVGLVILGPYMMDPADVFPRAFVLSLAWLSVLVFLVGE